MTARLWQVSNGKELHRWQTPNGVRAVAFTHHRGGGPRTAEDQVLIVTDNTMKIKQKIMVFQLAMDAFETSPVPVMEVVVEGPKIVKAMFDPENKYILTGDETGSLAKYDVKV